MSKGDKVSIELVGGPPWGFRLGGGADFGCPLEIAKLRKKSKAFTAGLAEGDVVTRIDHQDVGLKSHGDAMKIIELAGQNLRLEIIKGVGPSANLMSTSLMSTSQIDGVMDSSVTSQAPVEATVVFSREPSVSRSTIDRPRERSTSRSRTLKVISVNKQVEPKPAPAPVRPAHKPPQSDPWTVDVTSYQFANVHPAPPTQPNNKPMFNPAPRQPPPTSPKPKFKANTLPRSAAAQNSFSPVIPSWGAAQPVPTLQPAWNEAAPSQISSPQLKTPMFKVAKVEAKTNKWQPTSVQSVDYNNPRHQFNGMMSPPQPPSVMSTSMYSEVSSSALSPTVQFQQNPQQIPQQYPQLHLQQHLQQHPQQHPQQHLQQHPQQHPQQYQPQNTFSPQAAPAMYIPEPPPMMSPNSMKKRTNHIPGMVNPLICDDSQGDFGTNSLVRPDTIDGGEYGTSKKMYSDSAFYDSPLTSYPTIQEQVAMAKEISNILESNQNKRSRGGRMFTKRKNRAEDWAMSSQGQRRDSQLTTSYDSLDGGMPRFSMQRKEFGYNQVRHHPDPIKSKLNAAELEQIQHNQDSLCKHDALPPNIAFDINQALSQSHGKAGQFFEKRRQRAEKYVVDENNRRAFHHHQPNLHTQIEQQEYSSPNLNRPYRSPWEAASEGRLDSAFTEEQGRLQQQQQQQQAMMSNGYVPHQQQQQPLSVITNQQPNAQPQLNVKYKTFTPVKPSFAANQLPIGGSSTLPKTRTRLDMMLENRAGDATSTALSNPQQMSDPTSYNPTSYNPTSYNQYQNTGMMQSYAQQPGAAPMTHQYTAHNQPAVFLASQPAAGQSSFSMSSLKRPKDYLQQGNRFDGSQTSSSVSAF